MIPKIILVEDKRLIAEDLEDRLVSLDVGEVIGKFASGEEALQFAEEHEPDIAILDIQLKGEMDGIELAGELSRIHEIAIIYLTNREDDETLKKALPTSPVAYINKPFTNNEIQMAVVNAIKFLEQYESGIEENVSNASNVELVDDRIFVRNGRGKFSIYVDDILWIQSGGGEKSTIYTKDYLGEVQKIPPSVGYSLSKLEPKLSFYKYFIRCSRYYIINLKKVERIVDDVDSNYQNKGKKALLVEGNEIKVGDKYRKQVMDRFHIV